MLCFHLVPYKVKFDFTRLISAFILLNLFNFSFAVYTYSGLGCYSSLPSGYVSRGTYTYQTPSYCEQQCQDYPFYALTNGNQCYCGNSGPSISADGTCTSPCTGYGTITCGGSDSFEIYGDLSAEASSDTSTITSTSDTSTDTSTDSESPDVSENEILTSNSQSTVYFLTTQITTSGGTQVVYVTYSKTSITTSIVTTVSDENDSGSSKSKLIGPIVGGEEDKRIKNL
ncbi:WSC domain-containing protein ASCRUDRAFT_72071 [Ascoidea rubescens DSM 1968]|uniref:WSC domain-containing protein n=1 Tax=Ascoidea rubescens DSM 1968 TaxID=1344418 RepID=A0A1D2VBX3_9ASCO|nr:hypothetical protein ASCRUDRAFT_72071 [Ascoidea rubescens DSM 1968]ODV58983.1 hypothetical protein ASCRUDRAFT_72071 [Ascoidea rubescens DSM 1968]